VKEHITAVGVLNIGLGILGVVIACVVLAGTIGPGFIALMAEGDPLPLSILAVIGGFVALFLVVLSVPGIVGGIGLLRYRPWARYLTMIVAALALFNIPIGTIVGAYTLGVLVQDKAAKLFAPEGNL
jgi:hypothetical protein